MTVETGATRINQLNALLPTDNDPLEEGDDHIRLLKAVLQNQFVSMPDNWNYQTVLDVLTGLQNQITALQALQSTTVYHNGGYAAELNSLTIYGDCAIGSTVTCTTLTASGIVSGAQLKATSSDGVRSVGAIVATGEITTRAGVRAAGNITAFDSTTPTA